MKLDRKNNTIPPECIERCQKWRKQKTILFTNVTCICAQRINYSCLHPNKTVLIKRKWSSPLFTKTYNSNNNKFQNCFNDEEKSNNKKIFCKYCQQR